nr:MAK10-like protein [Tanacetum cinerariifolium]
MITTLESCLYYTAMIRYTAKGILKLSVKSLQPPHQVFGAAAWGIVRRTINQSAGGKLHDRNAKESWALLEDPALYDNESWNDQRNFAKLVKVIYLPQDVPSTSDRRFIELENQVQRLMKAHIAPTQPTQVKKITSSYARLSKFQADFKRQQSEMTNKIDTMLKAITDRLAGALLSDTVKNPKLNVNSTTLVLSARSYPTKDPQCSTHIYGSINTITIHPKQQSDSHDDKPEEYEGEEKNIREDININPSTHSSPKKSLNSIHSLNRSAWAPNYPT